MPVRIGVFSVAHLHAVGYVVAAKNRDDVEFVGIWDDDTERGELFAQKWGVRYFANPDVLLQHTDGIVVASENKKHLEMIRMAAEAGKHVLCEKPLVTSREEADELRALVARTGVKLMTAFPCRYSPSYARLKERLAAGEIGKVRAICATNRGRCPFDWFVKPELSGGGAMIDHVVHVADLLRDLLGEVPEVVEAQVGNNMYGGDGWEDTAMLTLQYSSGIFVTLDSSWSRPQSFKTWGDVTMNVVGESGVIELDMFNQHVDLYTNEKMRHTMQGFGSNLDALLTGDFVRCIVEPDYMPPVDLESGIAASMVAIRGYESLTAAG